MAGIGGVTCVCVLASGCFGVALVLCWVCVTLYHGRAAATTWQYGGQTGVVSKKWVSKMNVNDRNKNTKRNKKYKAKETLTLKEYREHQRIIIECKMTET